MRKGGGRIPDGLVYAAAIGQQLFCYNDRCIWRTLKLSANSIMAIYGRNALCSGRFSKKLIHQQAPPICSGVLACEG
jgi:hypothetical protein